MNIETARHVIASLQYAVNMAKSSGVDVLDLVDALRNVDAPTRTEIVDALGEIDRAAALGAG